MKFYNHNWTKFDRANWANSLQKHPKKRIFNGIFPKIAFFVEVFWRFECLFRLQQLQRRGNECGSAVGKKEILVAESP